ncbi:hypothetical protein JZ751_028713 [Albula glossodonta]|uniref:Uncharacterized protein n=1 Tax=Albula glossodonta TaxID=121402 RepID=A0A8T2MRQ6_9TELE|nr:hypothetical protein JZ751_028713 [Albula glossodonta]
MVAEALCDILKMYDLQHYSGSLLLEMSVQANRDSGTEEFRLPSQESLAAFFTPLAASSLTINAETGPSCAIDQSGCREQTSLHQPTPVSTLITHTPIVM